MSAYPEDDLFISLEDDQVPEPLAEEPVETQVNDEDIAPPAEMSDEDKKAQEQADAEQKAEEDAEKKQAQLAETEMK